MASGESDCQLMKLVLSNVFEIESVVHLSSTILALGAECLERYSMRWRVQRFIGSGFLVPVARLVDCRSLPVLAMDVFSKLFGNFIAFVYHCFDRIVIHGYAPGHVMQLKGSKKDSPGASGWTPSHNVPRASARWTR